MNTKSLKFNVNEPVDIFLEHGGQLLGCELDSMQDLYTLMKDADKIITF